MKNIIHVILSIGLFYWFSFTCQAQLVTKTPPAGIQKQIDNYIDLVKKYKEEENNLELAKYYNKIGFLYWESNSTKEAILFFSKSIRINEETGNQNAVKSLLTNIGMIYFDASDFDNALMFFSKSLKINEQENSKSDIASDLINIAMTHQAKEDFQLSNKNLEKALSLSQELNNIALIKNCFSMLAENYESLGESKLSMDYYEKYSALQKELQKEQFNELEERTKTAEAQINRKEKELQNTADTLREVMAEKAQIELLRQRENEIANMKMQEEKRIRLEEKQRNRIVFGFLSGIVLLAFLFILVVLFQIRQKKKANTLLSQKNVEIEKQKAEIQHQHMITTEQQEKLTDSIHYAQRIQRAILPHENHINEILNEYFILFKPRDIVSGDFYWVSRKDNLLIVVAADCTGHGVPGAFMSMLGIAFLNEIVNKIAINKHISSMQANEILNQLRDQVINSLHQREEHTQTKDGMDMSLCIVDYDTKKVQFSGAHNPLYIIRNEELLSFKGDKMPVGMHRNAHKPFTNNIIDLEENDLLYLFSDGFVDQFGGKTGEKYLAARLKDALLKICSLPLPEQKTRLEETLTSWRGNYDQLDDILVFGMKFTSKTKKVAPSKDRNWGDKRVLIVEDTDINYFLLVEALRPTGIQIIRANNGLEAVEFCKKNETDIVLMDINMPEMDGNEATRQIKSFKRKLPIIAQTAQNEEGEKEKSMNAGCSDYISKPIDLKTFLNTLEKYLY